MLKWGAASAASAGAGIYAADRLYNTESPELTARVEEALSRAESGPISKRLLSARDNALRKNYRHFLTQHYRNPLRKDRIRHKETFLARRAILNDIQLKRELIPSLVRDGFHTGDSLSARSLRQMLARLRGVNLSADNSSVLEHVTVEEAVRLVQTLGEHIYIVVRYNISPTGTASFEGPYFWVHPPLQTDS